MQDTVRQVHLSFHGGGTLTSIISSLTGQRRRRPEREYRIDRLAKPGALMDASDFFARSRFSKLRRLDLTGDFRISSWDSLATRTTLLTTLSLSVSSPPPTASQLFSILTSNPNLQLLALSDLVPPDSANGSALQVPLRNSKLLSLRGEFRHLFGWLRRLELPETLDTMGLVGFDATVEGISQNLEPYIRDYFRRDVRFQDRLEVSSISCGGSVSVSVCFPGAQNTVPTRKPFVAYTVVLINPPPDIMERLSVDFITLIPQEYVVSLSASLDIDPPEELFLTAPNIEFLCLSGVDLSEGFLQPNPDGPRANMKLLPSLRSLRLENIGLDDNDWGHLITYLAHQTSDDRIISLDMRGYCPYMCPGVANKVKDPAEFVPFPNLEGQGRGTPRNCCCSSYEEDE